MMINFILSGAALIALVGAVPDIFARQQQCNRDNCLRAVAASNTPGGSSRGSADCSSFFLKTVTPCPITSTVTQTSTVVGPATTLTVVSPTTTTTLATSTVTSTTTADEPLTVTVTNTVAAPVGPAKRQGSSTCTAVTRSPSAVPTYASACSGTVRYSSACSCIGVAQSTTTLTPSTVMSTVTQTQTSTPIETTTNTPLVTETTVTTMVVPTTVYPTTTTVTATVQPGSNSFNIYNSYYRTDTSITVSSQGYLFASFDNFGGAGFPFVIDEQGYLKVYLAYIAATNDPSFQDSDLSTPDSDIPFNQRLRCALSNPATSSGRLTCTTASGRSTFYICPQSNRNYRIGLTVPEGCSALILRTDLNF